MNTNILIRSFFVCSILFLIACTGGESKTPKAADNKVYGLDDLYGRWEVVAAHRNGQATESLYGAYFDFQDDGMLLSNITGEEEETPFEYKEGHIFQKGPSPLTYAIKNQSDSTLTMGFVMRGTNFDFSLKKSE